jgi:hypothetical protein
MIEMRGRSPVEIKLTHASPPEESVPVFASSPTEPYATADSQSV